MTKTNHLRVSVAVLAAALAAGLLLMVGGTSQEAESRAGPPNNGKITFQSFRDGKGQGGRSRLGTCAPDTVGGKGEGDDDPADGAGRRPTWYVPPASKI